MLVVVLDEVQSNRALSDKGRYESAENEKKWLGSLPFSLVDDTRSKSLNSSLKKRTKGKHAKNNIVNSTFNRKLQQKTLNVDISRLLSVDLKENPTQKRKQTHRAQEEKTFFPQTVYCGV